MDAFGIVVDAPGLVVAADEISSTTDSLRSRAEAIGEHDEDVRDSSADGCTTNAAGVPLHELVLLAAPRRLLEDDAVLLDAAALLLDDEAKLLHARPRLLEAAALLVDENAILLDDEAGRRRTNARCVDEDARGRATAVACRDAAGICRGATGICRDATGICRDDASVGSTAAIVARRKLDFCRPKPSSTRTHRSSASTRRSSHEETKSIVLSQRQFATTNQETNMAVQKGAHRNLASLKLPRRISALIAYAQGIVKGITNNPNLPSPVPTVAELTQALTDLQNAETAALARTKGAVAARNEKRTTVVSLLQQLRGYVQVQADGNPENGASIIESAGLAVKKAPSRAPRVFSAKAGPVSGEVKVVAPSAGPRTSYEWEYSTDGGTTWLGMPPTIQARTSLVGLKPATSVMFKYRWVGKTGVSDWSLPITLPSVK